MLSIGAETSSAGRYSLMVNSSKPEAIQRLLARGKSLRCVVMTGQLHIVPAVSGRTRWNFPELPLWRHTGACDPSDGVSGVFCALAHASAGRGAKQCEPV